MTAPTISNRTRATRGATHAGLLCACLAALLLWAAPSWAATPRYMLVAGATKGKLCSSVLRAFNGIDLPHWADPLFTEVEWRERSVAGATPSGEASYPVWEARIGLEHGGTPRIVLLRSRPVDGDDPALPVAMDVLAPGAIPEHGELSEADIRARRLAHVGGYRHYLHRLSQPFPAGFFGPAAADAPQVDEGSGSGLQRPLEYGEVAFIEPLLFEGGHYLAIQTRPSATAQAPQNRRKWVIVARYLGGRHLGAPANADEQRAIFEDLCYMAAIGW